MCVRPRSHSRLLAGPGTAPLEPPAGWQQFRGNRLCLHRGRYRHLQHRLFIAVVNSQWRGSKRILTNPAEAGRPASCQPQHTHHPSPSNPAASPFSRHSYSLAARPTACRPLKDRIRLRSLNWRRRASGRCPRNSAPSLICHPPGKPRRCLTPRTPEARPAPSTIKQQPTSPNSCARSNKAACGTVRSPSPLSRGHLVTEFLNNPLKIKGSGA